MSGGAASLASQAAALAALLPPLLTEARKVAASLRSGAHGRRRAGSGDAFWQFRRYQPGDPADEIDWRQSAKSPYVFLREKEWEAQDRVWLWADPSASMRWRSIAALPEKGERALVLALALAFLLAEGGESVAALGGAADFASSSVERLGAELMALPASEGLPSPLPKAGARVVLISDFLLPPERIETALQSFAASASRGHLVHLLDPAEASFPYSGRVRFSGLEGEAAVVTPKAEDLRAEYDARLATLQDRLRRRAHAMGWSYTQATTDQPALTALSALHFAIRGG